MVFLTAAYSHQCFIPVYKIFNNMLSKINIIHRRVYVIFFCFCLFLFIALQMLVSLFTYTSLEIVHKVVLHQSLNATLVGLKIYLD